MANEGYTGVPTTEAPIEAPNDYQHIEATPASFGAATAEGTQELGAGIEKGVQFYGQVAADNATNNTLRAATALLHGDPNKPATDANGQPILGPDGKPVPDTGFFGKRGADAMSAFKDTSDSLDELIRDQRESLSTPQARLQYDVESRRYRAQWLSQMSEYADTQQRVWTKDTNDNTASIHLNEIGRAADDPYAFVQAREGLRQAYVKNAQLEFGDSPQVVQGAILKADQVAATTAVSSLIGQNNGAAAQRVLDSNRNVLAGLHDYRELNSQVKEAVATQSFSPSVNMFMNGIKAEAQGQVAVPGQETTPQIADIQKAILGQESNDNPNIRPSPKGAIGIGQIKPATFDKYAKPGENINNPVDNRNVSARILQDYATKYNGDIGRIATAYFSGEGNVAPAGSPTPYIADKSDGKVLTSQYVANIESRLAKYPSAADALAANETDIHDRAVEYASNNPAWKDYPDIQQRFVQTVDREREQQVSVLHNGYTVDSHIVQEAVTAGHPISEQDLMATSPQVAAAWQRMKTENYYGSKGIEAMFDSNAHGAARVYGMGFKDYLDRTLGPPGPNGISNPAQVWPYVGKGDDAILTNTGADALSRMMKVRSGPNGEANAQSIKTFVDTMHGNMTFTNPVTGVYDEKGEARFMKYMSVALPVLEQSAKSGSLGDVLNPQSKNYVGNAAAPFIRPAAETVRDRLEIDNPNPANGIPIHHPLARGPAYATPQALDAALKPLDNDRQRNEAIVDLLKSGRLNINTYRQYHAQQTGQTTPAGFGTPPTPVVRVPPGGQ